MRTETKRSQAFPITDLLDLFHLPQRKSTNDSIDCCCPICGNKHFKMNVIPSKNIWRCNACGRGGGSAALYVWVTRGIPYSKDMRAEIIPEITRALNLEAQEPYTPRETWVNRFEEATRQTPVRYTEVSDFTLNLFHQMLFQLPLLKLRQDDKQLLLGRGLDERTIERNQYHSFRTKSIMKAVPKEWIKLCEEEHWEQVLSENGRYKKLSREQLLTALVIGQQLASNPWSIPLDGIPGAFKLRVPSGSYWGMRLYDGILIPLRNAYGEVVGIQVKMKNPKGAKYMMVSSRGLPCGRSGRNYVHYPLANREGERKDAHTAQIIEGPLKSDIYACLAPDHTHKILALIGVSSTNGVIKALKAAECPVCYECFDMDKLLKPSVMEGAKKLKALCKKSGIRLINTFWDQDGIDHFHKLYLEKARELSIDSLRPGMPKPFQIAALRQEMARREIELPSQMTEWSNLTKGIDDYMLMLRAASKAH